MHMQPELVALRDLSERSINSMVTAGSNLTLYITCWDYLDVMATDVYL